MTRASLRVFALSTHAPETLKTEDFAGERSLMVEGIERMAASVADQTCVAQFDWRVVQAMANVPRHEFVPYKQRDAAYKNRALSIGKRQSISQPFIVALMTELLQVRDRDTVLEVGTGSGYQAAVLSVLAAQVYSIELIPELGNAAHEVLTRLRFANVTTKIGNGYRGWKEHAPFDAIIITAAPDHVPPALVEQLKPNARMVIPVGVANQDLKVVVKNADLTTTCTTVVPVSFVPLIRE